MVMMEKLPKNIRQIGSPGDKQKVYIEDYVYTYLHVFLKEKSQDAAVKAALIFGEYYEQEGITYSFIKGAMSYDFSLLQEEFSQKQLDQMQYYFPGWELLGWYVSSPGLDAGIQSEIKQYYAKKDIRIPYYLIYEDELEREIQVFAWAQNALHYLEGYYIYYEKNPRMQEFLIMEKGGRAQEAPVIRTRLELKPDQQQNLEKNLTYVRDKVNQQKIREIKTEERQKKEGEPAREKKPQRIIYAACAAVLVLVAAMSISQLGNYQSLKNLQEAISNRFVSVQEKVPEEALPEEKLPEETLPEDALPEETLPEETLPEEALPEETTPQEGVPEEMTPEVVQPEEQQPEEPDGETGLSDTVPETYVVKTGDTLYTISQVLYGDEDMVEVICQLNGITNVNLIFEGQTLKLP